MQDDAKILYESIARVILDQRKDSPVGFLDFCYGNDIPKSSYDDITKAKNKATFYNVYKIIRALGLNFEEFGALLDKALPPDFWEEA